jgi:4-carboxymuconolactone decarboxylase
VRVETTGPFGIGGQRGVVAEVARHRSSLRSGLMEPRLQPRPRADWDDETRARLGDPTLNIFATLAHHPKLLKRWLVFGNHVLAKSTLPPRERELLILRTGWNCRAPYEWGQHVAIARGIGIGDDEIARVAQGPDAAGWSEADATLLRAADELHHDQTLSDATYAALESRYDAQGLLDLVFTVGQYHLVSMALNAFRVERDDGVTGVPVPARE